MLTVNGTVVLTTIAIELEVTGLIEGQVTSVVMTTLTISPSDGVYVNTLLFVPASTPLTFHWYMGAVPGLTAIAVKITVVPVQTGF
jgi:hypothetical protein